MSQAFNAYQISSHGKWAKLFENMCLSCGDVHKYRVSRRHTQKKKKKRWRINTEQSKFDFRLCGFLLFPLELIAFLSAAVSTVNTQFNLKTIPRIRQIETVLVYLITKSGRWVKEVHKEQVAKANAENENQMRWMECLQFNIPEFPHIWSVQYNLCSSQLDGFQVCVVWWDYINLTLAWRNWRQSP